MKSQEGKKCEPTALAPMLEPDPRVARSAILSLAGRLAQLAEHRLDKVISPVFPSIRE